MDPLPDEAVRFLDEHIDSIEQIEILRVLAEDPSREWGAADLAPAVQAAPDAVAAHLVAFGTRGLAATVVRGGATFGRYQPRTPELAALAARVLTLYRERPVTMIKYVYAKAAGRLKAFADAFKLRKDG